MLGEDVGGDAAGALPGGGVAQVRRRAKRLRELYAQLYKHIPDPRLREMMHATARNDGRAAFRLLEANCRQNIDGFRDLSRASSTGFVILDSGFSGGKSRLSSFELKSQLSPCSSNRGIPDLGSWILPGT